MKKKSLKQDEFCFDGLRVVSFSPDVFEDLRIRWNINDNDLLNSILEGLSGGGEGDGKSGMLFFTSKDKKYVIKTLKKVELVFLQSFLHDYAVHMVCFFSLSLSSSMRRSHSLIDNTNTVHTSELTHLSIHGCVQSSSTSRQGSNDFRCDEQRIRHTTSD